MADQNVVMDEGWRKRIKQVGRNVFELEEMIRLGFLDPEKLEQQTGAMTREQFDAAVKDLSEIRNQLAATKSQIESIGTVEQALAVIRSRRIERVKQERIERKAKKEEQRLKRAQEVRERRINSPTFLGREVSNRLNFTGGESEQLTQNGLSALTTFSEIASALSVEPSRLQWLAYDRGDASVDHYTRFEIPKRSGGSRLISSPKPALQQAQHWVLDSVLRSLPVHSAAKAFRPGLSIVDNASLHVGSQVVVRIDLKDFFPTITFPRVRGFFESLGYNPGVASVLALLCTDSPRVLLTHGAKSHFVAVGPRSLPQGACTSPALANLITRNLDNRVQRYADKIGWIYSRYADDLVFSTRVDDASPHRLTRAISMIVTDEGFQVNTEKTRVMRQPNRQMVTGLVVNEGVHLSRRDLRRLRAFFHRCSTRGLEAVSKDIGKDAMSVARGYMAYVHMVSPSTSEKLRRLHPWVK